ncbi:hypothetical protein [Azospirillum agricola]|uniref:hypothetical protein n=1 Tax=Azospirillum agricola TaxID=1720247 RepID=UPI000A0EFEC7|nr:hypothetical protein [Azospirillum agricola]MBP2232266.1 uncharacterized membrane protein YhaH (DUF805 family) [Azospirillum agricola]SMH56698.1 hypothetical protein SAMN02982994_4137 [Azospirillum lipoferum]
MQEFLQDVVNSPLFGLLLFNVAIVWPFWRILRRAGLPTWWALLVLIPFGLVPVIGVLAHSRWPVLPERRTRAVKARRSV